MKSHTHHKPKTNSILLILMIFLFLIIFLPIIFGLQQKQDTQSKADFIPKVKSQVVSQSKLGIFAINSSNGARQIISECPRVIKVMDPQGNASILGLMRDYKNNCPEGIVVVRIYEGSAPSYNTGNDPEVSAEDYWQKLLLPETNKLSVSDKQLISYLSGPNEYGNTPIIKNGDEAVWSGKFWAKLSEIMVANGFRPIMGEIPVGNLDASLIAPLVPYLKQIKNLGGAFSYHAYSLEYTTDTGVENWYSLRYRQFYDYLRQNAPDVADLTMILTEGGIDNSGNGATDGWNGTIPPRGNQDLFINWLQWFDDEIQKDSYILGVTLFQIGNNSDWVSFNLEPIAPRLRDYLNSKGNNTIPTLPPINTPAQTTPTNQPNPTSTINPLLTISPTPTANPNTSPSPTNNPNLSPTPTTGVIPTASTTPTQTGPTPTFLPGTPTPTPCQPYWCFIKQSECCFDPICMTLGTIANTPNKRCDIPRDYSPASPPTTHQTLFEQLKQLLLMIFQK
jgi:hypothetical protein